MSRFQHDTLQCSKSRLPSGAMEPRASRRVVKVGGSLLDIPDLPARLRHWLSSIQEMETLVIVGGGELIEQVRKLDEIHHFDAETVHWECVELLASTAGEFRSLVDDWEFIETAQQWSSYLDRIQYPNNGRSNSTAGNALPECTSRSLKTLQPTIVNVPSFYGPSFASKLPMELPNNWATTSDSIAALLARIVGAQEVVLLKSCNVPQLCTIEQAHRQGIVDAAFHLAIDSSISVRLVNLRDDKFPCTELG